MEPNNNIAMAGCVFPEDIMICILARVPVISIVRFKSVCKPWLNLFSTPWFIKMHQGPTHQHFVVQNMKRDTITLLNALKKKHTTLDHPIKPPPFCSIRIVGCCNGLFCITRGSVIALWNPATNMSKQISPSGFRVRYRASLGFGFDSEGSDFKVVRMVLEEPRRRRGEDRVRVIGVEVYSVLSDSWTTINHDIGYPFSVSRKGRNDVIVNGNPYWHAKVIDGMEFLLGFDVNELLFNVLPVFHKAADFMFDYNGRLGALVCKVCEGRTLVGSLDVWVFDDVAWIWREDRTYNGVFKACVERVLQFSTSGMVFGVRSIGRVCAFSHETGRDQKFRYAVQRGGLVEVFGYTESLAYVRGMEQVKLVSGRHFGRDWLL